MLERLRNILIPQDTVYFDLFERQAEVVSQCVRLLPPVKCIGSSGSPSTDVVEMQRLEQEADRLTSELLRKAERAVITPIEQEDIWALAKQVDDVVDFAEEIIIKWNDYDIVADSAIENFFSIARESLALVSSGVKCLRRRTPIRQLREDMKACEHVADQLIRSITAETYKISIADIFPLGVFPTAMTQQEVQHVMQKAFNLYNAKLMRREIAELLESMVDACEHVFYALGNIYLKF